MGLALGRDDTAELFPANGSYLDDPVINGSVEMPLIGLEFHHIGVACASIGDETEFWTALGYRFEGDAFVDQEQGIRARFMIGAGPRLELIEDIEGSSTLAPWLKRNTKFYHMGYLADDFDSAMMLIRSRRAIVLRDPVQSVYFRARIAFFLMTDNAVIELIERGPISVT